MATGKFVAYYRVSTARQGHSGLGLEAQRTAVREYLDGGKWSLLKEFTEVESGKKNDRPQLAKALYHAKVTGARLVIAKLDRLSRNAAFLMGLRDSGVKFVAADLPEANEMVVGMMAVVAQYERDRISERTKAALAEARKRLAKEGRRLGNPNGANALLSRPEALQGKANKEALARIQQKALRFAEDLRPILQDIETGGVISNRGVARELNRREIQTARGAVGSWTDSTVARVRKRLIG